KHPDEAEMKAILEIFQLETYAKGDLFKEQNAFCKTMGFLAEGRVRVCFHKEDGRQITVKVVQQDALIADLISVRTQEKTPTSIIFWNPRSCLRLLFQK
ncbi:MAG: cyclic nucleotide-binding domain-containing protein, partial [Bacteroidota bacterium]